MICTIIQIAFADVFLQKFRKCFSLLFVFSFHFVTFLPIFAHFLTMSGVPHVYQPITHGIVWYQPITHSHQHTPSSLPARGITAAQQGAHKAIPARNMSDSTSKQGKLQATPLPCLPSTRRGDTHLKSADGLSLTAPQTDSLVI